jgi:signal peptidase II
MDGVGPTDSQRDDHSAESEAPRAPVRLRLVIVLALAALAADAASKATVVARITPGHAPIRILGGAVYLVQARNSGAAFSVGTGATIIFTVVSAAVVVLIIRVARRLTSVAWAVALGLVLGGALGNLTDRLFRSPAAGRGHVVEWISLFADDGHIWPIFNLADSCVVIGGLLAVLLSVRGVDFGGARSRAEHG